MTLVTSVVRRLIDQLHVQYIGLAAKAGLAGSVVKPIGDRLSGGAIAGSKSEALNIEVWYYSSTDWDLFSHHRGHHRSPHRPLYVLLSLARFDGRLSVPSHSETTQTRLDPDDASIPRNISSSTHHGRSTRNERTKTHGCFIRQAVCSRWEGV